MFVVFAYAVLTAMAAGMAVMMYCGNALRVLTCPDQIARTERIGRVGLIGFLGGGAVAAIYLVALPFVP